MSLDVFLLTYNCARRGIDPEPFIEKLVEVLPKEVPELFVFGVEEFCSIIDSLSRDYANRHFLALNRTILEAVSKKYGRLGLKFHTLALSHIGSIGTICITPYLLKFSNVRTASSGCGYLYSSLKGASGIRIKYCPSGRDNYFGKDDSIKTVDLTFANAHLSAYEGEYYYNKRNQQVIQLMRSLDFKDGYGFLKPGAHAFFMGDLNYRTTKDINLDKPTIKKLTNLQDQSLTNSNSIEDLVYQYDELSYGIRNDEVFTGFTEGCINFQPTYKYHVGTAIYTDKRAPSWCDRILYQSTYRTKIDSITKLNNDTNLPKINVYDTIKSLLLSDHRPVYMNIKIPFDPPESIVSSTGYLKILPRDQIVDHFHRPKDYSSNVFGDTVSGPTQIYIKPTRMDRFIQSYINYFVDKSFYKFLWYTTTLGGRLSLLVCALVACGLFLYFT